MLRKDNTQLNKVLRIIYNKDNRSNVNNERIEGCITTPEIQQKIIIIFFVFLFFFISF